ncbi:MAG: recombination regulator RecX [Clostridiales bacterium]|nr:recombination regulator RecX [Clostridiales bacterium]
MADPEECRRARRKAMQLLEHMDRTEKGLSERLVQAGFSREAAKDALTYVKSFGYIDDGRYARSYILSRVHTKSRRMLLLELKRKGVDDETACRAWEEVSQIEQPDERRVLRTLVEKKYSPGTCLDEASLRRLYAWLGRRGFGMEDISRVLDDMEIRRF